MARAGAEVAIAAPASASAPADSVSADVRSCDTPNHRIVRKARDRAYGTVRLGCAHPLWDEQWLRSHAAVVQSLPPLPYGDRPVGRSGRNSVSVV